MFPLYTPCMAFHTTLQLYRSLCGWVYILILRDVVEAHATATDFLWGI